MKCINCGRTLKNAYYYKGETYGIECWKNHCLPLIIAEQEAKWAEQDRQKYLRDFCYVETLKLKDMTKITNGFKRQFIPSVIEQFETKGFISHKQLGMITGSIYERHDFRHGGMLNGKDHKNYHRIAVEAGIQDKHVLILNGLMEEKDFE